MRMKIACEISTGQLTSAREGEFKQLDVAIPGSRIFGTDLYLHAFAPDGQPFDLADRNGKSSRVPPHEYRIKQHPNLYF